MSDAESTLDHADPGAGAPVDPDPGAEPAAAPDPPVDIDSIPAESSPADGSVEGLIDDLERVTRERDGYLDDMRRVAAEFANFRRQTEKRHYEMEEQAAARLVEQLLPVLDACDGALAHGRADVEPIHAMLVGSLQKSGLTVVRPEGEPFDPTVHEAVMHEAADDVDGPTVSEVLRTGYTWNGRVLRPALVKVRG